MGGTTSSTTDCDRFHEPDWNLAGVCAHMLAGAWDKLHYSTPDTQVDDVGDWFKGQANNVGAMFKAFANAVHEGASAATGTDSGCSAPCIDARTVEDLLALDWQAAEDHVVVDMDQWDSGLYELILMAIALILANEDILDWVVCILRGYGHAGCLTKRLSREQSQGDNPWYIDVRDVADSSAMLSWPGWQVALWNPAPTGAGYVGGGGIGPTHPTYWPADRDAAEKGGFTIIDIDHDWVDKVKHNWLNGVESTRAAAVIDVAAGLVHELAHVCNSWDDELSDCPRVDVIETMFQWALATRYKGVSASTCYQEKSDAFLLNKGIDSFHPMFIQEMGSWKVNPAMFASSFDFSSLPVGLCV